MNSVNLLGRITKDLELKGNGDVKVLSFSLAVNRSFKKEGQPSADFITCKAFGKTAEFITNYMAKGSQIAVEGRIQTGSYDNKEGNKVYTTDVIVDRCYFADSAKKKEAEWTNAAENANDVEEIPF